MKSPTSQGYALAVSPKGIPPIPSRSSRLAGASRGRPAQSPRHGVAKADGPPPLARWCAQGFDERGSSSIPSRDRKGGARGKPNAPGLLMAGPRAQVRMRGRSSGPQRRVARYFDSPPGLAPGGLVSPQSSPARTRGKLERWVRRRAERIGEARPPAHDWAGSASPRSPRVLAGPPQPLHVDGARAEAGALAEREAGPLSHPPSSMERATALATRRGGRRSGGLGRGPSLAGRASR